MRSGPEHARWYSGDFRECNAFTLVAMNRDHVNPWSAFEADSPNLADVGQQRLNEAPNYLATARDGKPRVHPVSARIKGGRLALYMYPNSPKGKDLLTDGRYALHCSVADDEGGAGEFYVRGFAVRADDPDHQQLMADAGFPPKDGYVVFELGVDEAFSCTYETEALEPIIQRWHRPA